MKYSQVLKKKIWRRFKRVLLGLLAVGNLAQAQDVFYIIHNSQPYKILQLATNSQSNGTPIVLGDRNVGTTVLDGQSLWIYDAATHTIRLAANPNKCIHRAGQQMTGDLIQLWDYIPSGSPNQEWVFDDGRIKLKADQSHCLELIDRNFNSGNLASLQEVSEGGYYQKWFKQNNRHFILTADGQWRRIESPGDTHLDVAIPDLCPYPYLTIRARGGDGGYRTVNNQVKALGGRGATLTATYKIGTGPNELRPGTNIRLVIGTAGASRLNDANTLGAGGGGGTGVIYEAPGIRDDNDFYFPWRMLLVAGGGGGAYSDCCAVHRDGRPGNPDELLYGAKMLRESGLQTVDARGYYYYLAVATQDAAGRGWRADDEIPDPYVAPNDRNQAGAGFKTFNGILAPVGGRMKKNDHNYGGYGFGGGGNAHEGSGGGGGYSGGGQGSETEAMGGSSYVNWSMTMPGTGYMVNNGQTASSRNGYVEYQFSNTAPASRSHFEYGAQDIEILKSGAYTLKWQSDGNLVLYGPPGAIWTTGTNGRGKDLIFQGDGNLVIYEAGSAIWSSDTPDNQHGGKGGKTLTLNAEGMLSIADQDNKTIWRPTGPKALRYNSFEYGLQDVELLKCGTYTLKWQGDGNLVLYGPSGAVWASGTNGRANKLKFQTDGNLVIYNNSTAVWTSSTADSQHGGNGGRQLMLNADGWLTILDKYWQTVGGWGFNAQP